tara:strand:+ start:18416 stop:18598 length:183 start_codon:yes stop_codon:yes gene_type:complete
MEVGDLVKESGAIGITSEDGYAIVLEIDPSGNGITLRWITGYWAPDTQRFWGKPELEKVE